MRYRRSRRAAPKAAAADGTSWAKAFTSVSKGLSSAAEAIAKGAKLCEVWVAEGTYNVFSASVNDSVALVPKVKLYGGFAGTEAVLADRDLQNPKTVLDGRKKGDAAQRVRHVVLGASDALVDGFTIAYGSAAGATTNGGGMVNDGVSPTVRNCVFHDNHAAKSGGAVWNRAASPLFESCVFYANDAADGGAVASEGLSKPKIVNCTFPGNSATATGGAVKDDGDAATAFVNCAMWGDAPDEIASAKASVSYCLVQGAEPWPGPFNISDNPRFQDAAARDYHLKSSSPCIDRGDDSKAPKTDLEGKPRRDVADAGIADFVADIGAFEF